MKSFVINPEGENKAKRLAPLQQKTYFCMVYYICKAMETALQY